MCAHVVSASLDETQHLRRGVREVVAGRTDCGLLLFPMVGVAGRLARSSCSPRQLGRAISTMLNKYPDFSATKSHDVSVAGLQLIHAYRDHGHRIASLDPLGISRPEYTFTDLSPTAYGLTAEQLEEPVALAGADASASGFARSTGHLTLSELHSRLLQIYSGSMGIETVHCKPEHMRWLEDRLESIEPIVPCARAKRLNMDTLTSAHTFEAACARRHVGVKRFGIEGAESVIVGLNALLERASDLGVSDVVMGMPHRGRLNVLANVAMKPIEAILCEFRGGAAGTLADEQRLREQSDRIFDAVATALDDEQHEQRLCTTDLHAGLHRLGIDATYEEAQAAIDIHDQSGDGSLNADEFFSLVCVSPLLEAHSPEMESSAR